MIILLQLMLSGTLLAGPAINAGFEYSQDLHQKERDEASYYRQISHGIPEGIVDISLGIEEGRVYFIQSINFSGLVETDEQSLRYLLPIRKGDLYRRRMIGETLKRLNQLGLFEEIQQKDTITRATGRNGMVEITIRVNEVKRQ